ncbi:MAG: hypothetical protein WEA09_07110 [Gemmatimonadota bacterium]
MFWIIILLVVVLIPMVSIVLDSAVGQALARRLENGGDAQEARLLRERISVLEGEVDRLSGDLDRLDEESRFLQQLLAARPEPGKSLPSGDTGE